MWPTMLSQKQVGMHARILKMGTVQSRISRNDVGRSYHAQMLLHVEEAQLRLRDG